MKPDCAGGIGSLSTISVVAGPVTLTIAVPVWVLKSTRFAPGSVSMKSTSAPAGINSWTVTLVPAVNVPASRHDHVDGSVPASFAVVLTAAPPFTLKLNERPMYTGADESLQIFRSPTVPPAGPFVNVTIVSLAAVEPGVTCTIAVRLPRSVLNNLVLGLVETSVTSVGGLVWSSTTRFAPACAVIAPVQKPPLTVNGAPPLSVNWKAFPDMPFVRALQISIFPLGHDVLLSALTASRS